MPAKLASGAALEVFASLDSTSLEARRRIEAGRCDLALIVALEQSAGYGRRGAAWTQSMGDFAGTFVLDAAGPRETIGQLSFVAALAVAETVERFAPKASVSLKWPNDALVGGGKIAGVLLELVSGPAGEAIALGVGVNVVSKPALADYPAARLIDYCGDAPTPSPEAIASVLDEALHGWRSKWRSDGFAPIRRAWLDRAFRLGDTVRVKLPDGEAQGVFEDLDPSGALVLNCAGTRRWIAAGAIVRESGG